MKLKHLFLISALTITCQLMAQNTTNLNKVVDEVRKEEGMRHASLSVCVYNINKDRTIFDYDGQRSLVPASISKILTTAAGFEQLGSNFRFKTTIEYSGDIDSKGVLHGNLYIIGGGDPLLGSYRYRQTQPDSLFSNWYSAIYKMGIRGIDGRIYYDASIFDNNPLNDTWQWGDIGNYYAGGVSGLNFHENMYFAYFNPGKKVGYPATIDHTMPKNVNVHNQNEVTTGPENSGDQVVIYGDPNNSLRHYKGTVPLFKNNFAVRGALPKPAESCAEMFAAYLRSKGLSVSNSVVQCVNRPSELKPILSYYSNTYYVIAQYTNQTSNNMYAESIFKYLGYKSSGKGTFDSGAKAVSQYLRSKSLQLDGIKIVDGSGLSHSNRLTASLMCRLLREVHNSNYGNDFKATLARTGQTGTAKRLLTSLPSNIVVNIKSGTLDGVKSYAGYVTTPQNEVFSFCIICNGHDCTDAAIKSKLERILREIATLKS